MGSSKGDVNVGILLHNKSENIHMEPLKLEINLSMISVDKFTSQNYDNIKFLLFLFVFRFHHYFDSITLPLKDTTLNILTSMFS